MRHQRMILGTVLAAVLLAHVGATTSYWTAVLRAPWRSMSAAKYRHTRMSRAFAGFPIDDLRAALDVYVPGRGRIALSDRILNDEFMAQRLTEGLYPRIVDARSPLTLDVLVAADRFDASARVVLLAAAPDRLVVLRGTQTKLPLQTPVEEPLSLDVLSLAAGGLSLLGFGLLVARAIPRVWRRSVDFLAPFALLAGAVVVALAASVATWLQLPLVGPVFGASGVVLALVLGVPRALRGVAALGPTSWPRRETWVMAAFVVVALAAMTVRPVVEWDGRSCWFFRAHQIHEHHRLALSDATRPDTQWSHFGYPLLLPAWLAQFTVMSGGYNERLAAIGEPALLAVLTALFWIFARERFGRWTGAALALAVFLTAAKWVFLGYADTLLMLLLAVEFLAFGSPDGEPAAWLALVAASLLKQEGLILGAMVAAPFLAQPARRRRLALAVAAVVPAALQQVWARALHLPGDFDNIHWTQTLSTLGWRLKTIVAAVWSAKALTPLILDAVAALAVAAALGLAFRRANRMTYAATMVVGGCSLFVVLAFTLTPRDLQWHLDTALHRLMYHPALFAVMTPFLLLSGMGTSRGSVDGERRDVGQSAAATSAEVAPGP